jgi:hypothetical protein
MCAGCVHVIDAAGPPLSTAPVLELLKSTVTSAVATDGVLKLEFANGFKLDALPDERYDSRVVSGPAGDMTCLPGGDIMVL